MRNERERERERAEVTSDFLLASPSVEAKEAGSWASFIDTLTDRPTFLPYDESDGDASFFPAKTECQMPVNYAHVP